MSIKSILSWLYLANATILITHQIDAAYWHEWDLFGMPGGIQLNLLLNIPLVMLMLFGQQRLTQGYADGFVFSWLLVIGGIIAVSLHSYFLLQGDDTFRLRLPVSLGLLAATFLLSLAQAIALFTLRNTRSQDDAQHKPLYVESNRRKLIAEPNGESGYALTRRMLKLRF